MFVIIVPVIYSFSFYRKQCRAGFNVEEEKNTKTYRTGDEPGFREAGFRSARLMMGTFSNDEFGRYTRYTYRGCKTCVVLKSGDKALVVNGKNDEETKRIYERLLECSPNQ